MKKKEIMKKKNPKERNARRKFVLNSAETTTLQNLRNCHGEEKKSVGVAALDAFMMIFFYLTKLAVFFLFFQLTDPKKVIPIKPLFLLLLQCVN